MTDDTRALAERGRAFAAWIGRPLPADADCAAYRLGLRLESGELDEDDFPHAGELEDEDD